MRRWRDLAAPPDLRTHRNDQMGAWKLRSFGCDGFNSSNIFEVGYQLWQWHHVSVVCDTKGQRIQFVNETMEV